MVRLLTCLIALAAALPALAQDRPNILWITVEDMSPWLACYGDQAVPTPNIDRLAAEGVRYTAAYATTPVCAPARAALITGMYATAIGAQHMRTGNPSRAELDRDPDAYADIPSYEATPPPEVRCFPAYLRIAGYWCTNNAKEDYQFRAPVTVWDESSGRAHWRGRADGQPFFAIFNIGVTHESGTFPSTRRQPKVVDPADVPVPPYYPDTPTVRADIARTYDNIAAMDRRVGQVLSQLEEDGLLDSTIIFFFSDHGVGLPRGKRSVYDSGTRVPLIVRFPDGHRAGETDARIVSFVDFAPTLLSLAGIEPPAHMQSAAFLGHHEAPPRRYAFINADRMDAAIDTTRAVTDGRYRLVRNLRPGRPHLYPVAYAENIPMMADLHALQASGAATQAQWQIVSTAKPPEEFYDTRDDPHEVRNLIDDPAHAEHIAELRAALDAWMQSTGDPTTLDERELVRRLWPGGVQPQTTPPSIQLTPDGDQIRITIRCNTPGASIGYRLRDRPWNIYTGPVALPRSGALHVIAHRIGFAPSEVGEVPLDP